MKTARNRALKKIVFAELCRPEPDSAIPALTRLPARQVINPLFSFLCHGTPLIRWHAISAMGAVTAALAARDMESARVILRRLMWSLNDESGGIGWGAPEALGDVTARHHGLAREYGSILASYICPGANYLEHPLLQRGVLWGIGRLCHVHPDPVRIAAPALRPFFQAEDPYLRGLSLWTAGPLANARMVADIRRYRNDPAPLEIYLNQKLVRRTVGQLARDEMVSCPRHG